MSIATIASRGTIATIASRGRDSIATIASKGRASIVSRGRGEQSLSKTGEVGLHRFVIAASGSNIVDERLQRSEISSSFVGDVGQAFHGPGSGREAWGAQTWPEP